MCWLLWQNFYVLEIFIENSHVSLSSKTLGNINRGFYMTDVFLLRLSSEFRIFLLLAYFFPIEVFSFNRGPVYHRQILFKGLKPSPAYL